MPEQTQTILTEWQRAIADQRAKRDLWQSELELVDACIAEMEKEDAAGTPFPKQLRVTYYKIHELVATFKKAAADNRAAIVDIRKSLGLKP